MGLAHWDDVEGHRAAKGEMDAEWQMLGRAAGTVGVGVNRVRVAPGKLPTPPHSHGASEEVFFILSGSGLAWQDGAVHEVRPLDCIIHRPDEMEHTFVAGPDGLEYLVFGTRHPVEYGWLPRSRAVRLSYPWVEGRTDDPWEIEAEVGELAFADPGARPENVVAFDELPLDEVGHKELAGSAGSERSGLNWHSPEHGRRAVPPHCHSAEEEAFVVLDGSGTLELLPTPRLADNGVEPESHELRAGHVVSRPAGTRVAHSIVSGPDGISYLAYGTREPNDIAYYPRSNKISFRGVGVIARLEHVEYGDGEPDDL